jgi:hypothetical protein
LLLLYRYLHHQSRLLQHWQDKTAEMEMRILSRIKEALENGDPVRSLDFNEEDHLQHWQYITFS